MMSCTKTRRWLNYAAQLLSLVTVVQMGLIGMINCLQFNYPDFSNTSDISFERTAKASENSTAWLLPYPDPTWATDPKNDSATILWSGWMAYEQPMPFLGTDNNNNGKAHSFNTSFTFKLITGGDEDSPSGMAFFIAPTASRPDGAIHRYFGFGNDTFPTSFFAVEFDTRDSSATTDPSASHIGIDINNINSSAVVDTSRSPSNSYYPELYLYSNNTFTAWISYDATLELTKVWMTNKTTDYAAFLDPPHDMQPIMEHKEDLSPTLSNGDMYVGFSAATESDSAMLGVAIYSWYFSISENPTAYVGAPEASPAPTPTFVPIIPPKMSDGSPPPAQPPPTLTDQSPSVPTLTDRSPPAPPPQSSANSEKQFSSSLLMIPIVIVGCVFIGF